MNGHNTLEKLAEVAAKDSARASDVMPILAGAMVDMTESIKGLGNNQEESRQERADLAKKIDEMSEKMTDIADKVETVNTCITDFKKNMSGNFAVKVGEFVTKYKNVSIFLAILAFTLFTLWSSFPGVRIWTMTAARIPKEIIVLLNP